MKGKVFESLSWWSAAFSINFIFQIYRGSKQDIAIFTLALVLVILESTSILDWIPEFKWLRDSRINIFVLSSVSLYLLFTKRESHLTVGVFVALFLFLFFDLWRRENGETRKLSKSELKGAKGWALIGIALCAWELIAFVLATISKDDYAHPTISVLISPHLDGLIGRAIFIVCWAAIGLVLINDWREPR